MLVSIQKWSLVIICLTFLGYEWHQLPKASGSSKTPIQKTSNSDFNTLDVRHIPQEELLCVPTSASMILAFYGDHQSPRKLKIMSHGVKYTNSMPFKDFSITFYRDIIRAASALGYDWREQTFEDTDSGFRRGLATIKAELVQRRPVMIDLSIPEGHTIVINGFDEDAQAIKVVDPNASAPGRYSISYKELRSIWNEHAFNGNFRSLVTTSPRRRPL